jgi:hypothetical protein
VILAYRVGIFAARDQDQLMYDDEDPEPVVDVDPTDGLLEPTPDWIAWHLAKPLIPTEVAELRALLERFGDEKGVRDLAALEQPTRFDHRRLLNIAELKYGAPPEDPSPSKVELLTF